MPTTDPAALELAAVEHDDATRAALAAPVPVTVSGAVTVTDRPHRSLTTDTLAVNGPAATRIVNAVISRGRLLIACEAAPVFIGSASVTVGTGFALAPGERIELTTRGEVYACSEAAALVRILSEHNDG